MFKSHIALRGTYGRPKQASIQQQISLWSGIHVPAPSPSKETSTYQFEPQVWRCYCLLDTYTHVQPWQDLTSDLVIPLTEWPSLVIKEGWNKQRKKEKEWGWEEWR
jgi:hypothetical protein